MSIQHIASVLEASGLCAQEKAVLTAFCNHTDPTGKTFAGEERLMRESGMPRTTFQRWRSQLVDRSLLISERKYRKGGGRTTSDTWVNLELLRSMRDAFFTGAGTDRPDDENPFSQVNDNISAVGAEASSKGPVSGANGGGKGSTDGAFKGPMGGAGSAPSVEPVTIINPQGEPHTLHASESVSAAGMETVTGVCEEPTHKPENPTGPSEASVKTLMASMHPQAYKKLSKSQRGTLSGRVGALMAAGWSSKKIQARLDGSTDANTKAPAAANGFLVQALADMESEETPDAVDSGEANRVKTLRRTALDRAAQLLSADELEPALNRVTAWMQKASSADLDRWMGRTDSDILSAVGAATGQAASAAPVLGSGRRTSSERARAYAAEIKAGLRRTTASVAMEV